MSEILSVGHSSQSYSAFAMLLKNEGVTAIADVRSSPFSKHYPQYNRTQLKAALAEDKISYVFLGRELGGRPNHPHLYTHGIADYEKMARTSSFETGLQRLERGAERFRIAMMCSEHDPLDCHRCLLVGRALTERGHVVRHIVQASTPIVQDQIEQWLLEQAGKIHDDMFAPYQVRLEEAYRERANKVAFIERAPNSHEDLNDWTYHE
ncbi:DUF488 family protein [Sphingopyxis witflariensis]|nr:DUF488 domain-containing protein [Sphingopyxis witflariensis]